MKEYSKIAVKKIGEFLVSIMEDKNLSVEKIVNQTGLPMQNVLNVLQIATGNGQNYSMDDFLQVCRIIGIHIDLFDLREKSNIDDKLNFN